MVDMDYMNAMRMFVRAVELGSFSRAAEALGTKTSAVSRAVASLEQDMNVGLFHRTTRRIHLTEPGATFYEHARGLLKGFDEARSATTALESRPQGTIHLHAPSAFARLHVLPYMPEFLSTYPDIRLEVALTDIRVDLVATGADVAIRIGGLSDSRLMVRKLAPHRRMLCASPAYLASAPPVREPDDLLRHNCLIYSLQPTDRWFFRHLETGRLEETPISGRLRVDDAEPLRDAALAGSGVVLLPSWLIGPDIREGRLVHLLPDWFAAITTAPSGVFGVYPPRRTVPPKVRAFLDFIQQRFGKPPYWDPHWAD
jgi:DNA-binding transcriptional LysR family regulator